MNLVANYTTIDVHQSNGILVTTSRNVAQVFGKNHADVLRDIRTLLDRCSDDFGLSNFAESSYTNAQNKAQPEYLITKDGLVMLIMGYTGESAMLFKEAYIKRFNEMEQALKAKREQFNSDPILQQMRRAEYLLGTVGIEGNQMTLALDKLHKNKTGESLLALTGIELVRPQQVHLATPTEIGQRLAAARGVESISGIAVNQMLAAKGYQERVNGKWVATELGKQAGATYLDVGKARSSGTPVTQMKWPIDILD